MAFFGAKIQNISDSRYIFLDFLLLRQKKVPHARMWHYEWIGLGNYLPPRPPPREVPEPRVEPPEVVVEERVEEPLPVPIVLED